MVDHGQDSVRRDSESLEGLDRRQFIKIAAFSAGALLTSRLPTVAIHALSKPTPVSDLFPKDLSAHTWLPVKGASALAPGDRLAAPVDDFLKNIDGRFRPLVCWYDGPHLAATRPLPDGHLDMPQSRWIETIKATSVPGDPTALDLRLTVTLKEGGATNAGVAVAFDFADWSTNNYVLIPASIYNGNRNQIITHGFGSRYAQGLPKSDWYRKDLPLTTRNLPHLATEKGVTSKLEVLTCNTATPCICFLNRTTGRAFIVLAEQAGRNAQGDFIRNANGDILDNGFSVEESPNRTGATLVVSAPGVRDKKPEFIGFSASPDRGLTLTPGDTITLKLRLHDFDARNIPGLCDKFMAVRKTVTGPNHPRSIYPMSEIFKRMTEHIDDRFYRGKQFQFYDPENGDWLDFGWVGGLMNTFPMLALDDTQHLERVAKTFDFAIPRAQGKAGYFYGALSHTGHCFGREGYPDPHIVLTRRNADVLYWMIKQFLLLEAQGRGADIQPAWQSNIRRLANAFVKTWREDGQWGNDLNVETGQVVIYNSTSAAQAMGGLALAARYYHDTEYLKVAEAAAHYYYQRDFLGWGATTGHSADTLQNADADSAYAFASSLMAIYNVTGNRAWLEKARNLLNLFASWVASFDYELPPNTALARQGAHLAGAVWASTQNKHSAPGECTSSSDVLFRVYRAIGDIRYADLLRDIFHAWQEGLHGINITERLSYCDADGSCRGAILAGSTGWCELNGALMALELPGIYLHTDSDRFYVFDSLVARVLRRDAAGVKLEIHNPTKYDAQVSIFAENGEQAKKTESYTAFLKWPKVGVKADQTITATVSPNGDITSHSF